MPKPKLALAMILKATPEEGVLLDRCLKSIRQYVDAVFITITGEDDTVQEVAEDHMARISYFPWIDDFAAARNFNWNQVGPEFDYILWLDADDVVRGAENIPALLERLGKEKVDAVDVTYEYSYDVDGNVNAEHDKARIIKNDGAVEWTGEVHEGFDVKRDLRTISVDDVVIEHRSTDFRFGESATRNLEIAKTVAEKAPEDSRSLWLLANAYASVGQHEDSVEWWEKFVLQTGSDLERFTAYIRMSNSLRDLARYTEATNSGLQALGLRPGLPDGYYSLADTYRKSGRTKDAVDLIMIAGRIAPPKNEVVAYNPRDYDLRPAQMLFDIYIDSDARKAKEALEWIYGISPSKKSEELLEHLDNEIEKLDHVEKVIEKIEGLESRKKIQRVYDNLPDDVKPHPKLQSLIKNVLYKETSSGKDISYYCAYTTHEWHPGIAKKDGVGGSEEAVIHLAKRWRREGWNVTVYCNTGSPKDLVFDGVRYRPFWTYNPKDKTDVLVAWRSPIMLDYDINADKIFVDLHDVIPEAEFTNARLANCDKIFVKTKAHRVLFPNIPDDKFEILPNGIDPSQFEKKVVREPYTLLNTSSPDRSLPTLLDLYEEVIHRLSVDIRKKVKLKWYYGWQVFDNDFKDDPVRQEFRRSTMEHFDKLKEQGYAEGGGKLNHEEIAKEYQKAGAFVYPTRFYEIHCISAAKAQVAGAVPIVTDFAALDETVQFGTRVSVDTAEDSPWSVPISEDFGIKDSGAREKWISAVVSYLEHVESYELEREEMSKWAIKSHDWDGIASNWLNVFSNDLL